MKGVMETDCARKPPVLTMAFILLFTTMIAAAADVIIYVDDDAAGENDGSSWPNAYKFLQDAFADAKSAPKPVEIRVAQGIYKPDQTTLNPRGTGDRKAAFQLINGVTLKGGYAGLGYPDPNDRNIDLYETILSGDLLGDDGPEFTDNSDNSYHVFYHPEDLNLNDTAILDGFIITAANADSASWHYGYGGGMYNRQSSPTVNNCTFTENSVGNYGGGMYNYNSSPIIDNCKFSENDGSSGGGMYNYQESNPTVNKCTFAVNAANSGGGMCNNESSPILENCKFSENTANSGGAMYNNDSSPIMEKCTFSENAAGFGGGMYSRNQSSPTVNDCKFIANSTDRYGGGMYNWESIPTVNKSTFSENTANYGGGISNNDSSPIVEHCTFTANSGDTHGGGMHNRNESSPTVENCTFTANSAGLSGAGIYNTESSPTVSNCTFTANFADNHGGAMSNYESSPTVDNCTFSENATPGSGGAISNNASSPKVEHCIFTENSAGSTGGGMSNTVSIPTVRNCIFSANAAHSGGGMSSYKSSPALNNCTFTANSAERTGGAMANTYLCSPTVTNSAIINNKAPEGPAIACYYPLPEYQSTVTIRNSIIWNGTNWLHNTDQSSITVSYSDVEGGCLGLGNIDAEPCFVDPGYWDPNGTPADANDDFWVEGDYHLLSNSPGINAGDPDFVAGPNNVDMDGEKRVMLGRVDMGADEFNPLSAQLVVVCCRRLGRTVFEYECEVVLQNVSMLALDNVSLKMARCSQNMAVSDPNVDFTHAEIGPGESISSIDTCTFTVDRSEPIDATAIVWYITAGLADTGARMLHTVSAALPLQPPDFDTLKNLTEKWLWQGKAGEISLDTVKDGTINLADFAKFARQWIMKGMK